MIVDSKTRLNIVIYSNEFMHFTFSINLVRFFFIFFLFSGVYSLQQFLPHNTKIIIKMWINRFPLIFNTFFFLLSLLKSLVVHGISLFNIFSFGCFMLLFRCITFINRMNYCLINIAHKLYWIGNIFINKTVFQSLLVCLPI